MKKYCSGCKEEQLVKGGKMRPIKGKGKEWRCYSCRFVAVWGRAIVNHYK